MLLGILVFYSHSLWGKAIIVVLLAFLANFYMGGREYGWSDLHFAA